MACVLRTLFVNMGLQGMVRGRSRCRRYQRLQDDEDVEKAAARPRRRWARKSADGKVLGFRVSSSKKRLTWRGFSLLLLPRRLCHMYAEVLTDIMALEGVHPTIVFSSQWGLPVLSHSSSMISCKKSAAPAAPLHRASI
ncbi:hypothetical protein Taro_028802 [Colocasia esculenta]|uniref:Uncharacterized protein n=1 Tax=Colocasia esculenta TaxID=4460 RepID=A0A843VV97_COLES|nr:hypothetical protein [Colocasia esculenta]